MEIVRKLSLSLVALALLIGCGSSDKEEVDQVPSLSVTTSVQLKENRTTTIHATATDDKAISSFSWQQISGPSLTLSNINSASVSIAAPLVSADATAVLKVVVTDSAGQSASANVTVNIANNKLPSVITEFVPVEEKSAVELKASVQDSDGSILSYSWEQTAGPRVGFTGQNSHTIKFTAPDVTENTTLVFKVRVANDDNETVDSSGELVVTQVKRTFALSGRAQGAAFANANIKGVIAGNTFLTTADADGNYVLPLSVDDDESNLLTSLTAESVIAEGLEFYRLIPALDLALTTEQRSLSDSFESPSPDSKSGLINPVTTSLYSLIVKANDGKIPSDIAEFIQVESAIAANELLEVAAVTKLLADAGRLPEGITNTFDLLSNFSAYHSYVSALEAAEPGVIAATSDEISAQSAAQTPVQAFSLPGVHVQSSSTKNGFYARAGNRIDFDQDGLGKDTNHYMSSNFDWSVVEGMIKISYRDNKTLSLQPVESSFRLTPTQKQQLISAGVFQLEVYSIVESAEWRLISEGVQTDVYRVTQKVRETVVPIDIGNGMVISLPDREIVSSDSRSLNYVNAQPEPGFTAQEMAGDWVLRSYQYDTAADYYSLPPLFAEVMQFQANGTGVTEFTNRSFSWSITDQGSVVLQFADNSRLEFIKLRQEADKVHTLLSFYNPAGVLLFSQVDYGLKLSDTGLSGTELLNSEGSYWNTIRSQWRSEAWDGKRLKWNGGIAYTGWEIKAEGKGFLHYFFIGNPPDFAPRYDSPLTWLFPDLVSIHPRMTLITAYCLDNKTVACRTQELRLLKEEQGLLGRRVYVLELTKSRAGLRSTGAETVTTLPRLGIFEELNIEYWNRTAPLELGALLPERKHQLHPEQR